MQVSWGNRLLIVFIVFGTMMFTLVYKSIKTNVDLVSKEYYKDELKYQQVIDGARHANVLGGSVTLHQSGKELTLAFPEEMRHKAVKGTALFYYAANAKQDRKIELGITADGHQTIDTKLFVPGDYMVKINWSCDNKNYYTEQNIEIK